MPEKKYKKSFFENVAPTKLTEGRRVKLHTEGWGLLTDYYLESVKINRHSSSGPASSTAVLKIGDKSGQITCIVKGNSIGLLFGLSKKEWEDIEDLCKYGQQLFYRQFKEGISKNFRCEEKLFYNFCLNNQKFNVLTAIFRRCVNKRNKDKSDALLQILELQECHIHILDLYITQLRNTSEISTNELIV